MIKFLTATAALALAASALHADPGGSKGGGKDHAEHAQATQGGGGGKDRGPEMRGGKPDRVEARAEQHANQGAKQGKGRSAEARGNSGKDRVDSRDDVREVRDVRIVRDGRDDRDRFDWDDIERRGLVEGCPPGLAKKDNGCMPPGLARDGDRDRRFAFFDRPDWWGMNGIGDGRFAFANGSLLRLGDGGNVLGYLPLLGGALSPGNVWPSFYDPVALPAYYQDYYGLGPVAGYRYYDDAIYHVDPETSAITSIAALLTGDDFGIGQALPAGYDVYNVPYSYRDQYVDGPDAMYRYSDGYVYQADPTTQLITAAIELLT